MGALNDYDDMMGYEFGEYGLDELITMEMIKEFSLSGAAGAAAILATTFSTQKLAGLEFFKTMKPENRARAMSGVAIVLGMAGGRALYYYNRDAAMGVVGGTVGLGLANLLGTFFQTNPLGAPLGELADGDDDGLLSDYDYETINGLAEAAVESHDPAFRNLGPMAPQLSGVMVNQEALGQYAPYLS